MLILASVTDAIANWATGVVGDLGLPGIFLLMVPESAGIPIPSEATMLFAGFNVNKGEYALWAAVLTGTVANVVGSWIAYGIGYFGRQEVLTKHAKFFHASPENLARADRWFEQYGSWAVFFSRMLPVVRTFISFPAGAAKMPFGRFTLFTFLGCLPWIFMLTFIGDQVGANWTDWKGYLHYVDYTVAVLIVAAVAYFVIRWWRRRGSAPPAEPDAPHTA